MEQQNPYQLLGENTIRTIAHTFYDVMDEMPQAEKIRAMHAKHKGDIKQKLTEYLTGWLGGPPLYSDKTGTVCLTDPHKPYPIGPKERDQWLMCWYEALERVGVSEDVKSMLKDPMYRLADTVRNCDNSDPITHGNNGIPIINV